METISRPRIDERLGELLEQVPNNWSGAIWPMHRLGLTNYQIAALCDMKESRCRTTAETATPSTTV
jgi:hypothetical protein